MRAKIIDSPRRDVVRILCHPMTTATLALKPGILSQVPCSVALVTEKPVVLHAPKKSVPKVAPQIQALFDRLDGISREILAAKSIDAVAEIVKRCSTDYVLLRG